MVEIRVLVPTQALDNAGFMNLATIGAFLAPFEVVDEGYASGVAIVAVSVNHGVDVPEALPAPLVGLPHRVEIPSSVRGGATRFVQAFSVSEFVSRTGFGRHEYVRVRLTVVALAEL